MRTARQLNCMHTYHIIARGVNKQDIFLDDYDRNVFLKYLKETKEKFYFEIYAYCLMDNHIHIILKDPKDNLSKIMQCIGIRYSRYFNKKYERVGHLFQNRFCSKNIKDKGYLLRVQKYIHQNPEIAGICKTDKYKWSSINEYICEEKICNTEIIYDLFRNNGKKDIVGFKEFTLENTSKKLLEDLELEGIKKINDKEAIKLMQELLEIDNLTEIANYNKKLREEYIIKIKSSNMISTSQIARIIGINRKIVERVNKK